MPRQKIGVVSLAVPFDPSYGIISCSSGPPGPALRAPRPVAVFPHDALVMGGVIRAQNNKTDITTISMSLTISGCELIEVNGIVCPYIRRPRNRALLGCITLAHRKGSGFAPLYGRFAPCDRSREGFHWK